MTFEVRAGDCLDVMAEMPGNSVDSIVSDPPYGLSFMGKQWDHGVPGVDFWREALRVAKPGAYLVAFGGTRTYHRLTCAIEDAGWEIRDCLSWLYGSGFPKSHNGPWGGTALKPAWEPIILARKPLIGTVAANVAQHGTGGLNVDGCRIGTDGERVVANIRDTSNAHEGWQRPWQHDKRKDEMRQRLAFERMQTSGRWPANVCLDEEAAGMLDAQSGSRGAQGKASGPTLKGASTSNSRGKFNGVDDTPFYGDSGGASRFFYTAKASRREREAGLEGMPERRGMSTSNGGREGAPMTVGAASLKGESVEPPASRNFHPTVKPIALMRWLCRLVTPPNGVVLDPFTGSGTTGCAAVLEGFRFVGIEREPEYVEIAEKRIAHWAGQAEDVAPDLFGG